MSAAPMARVLHQTIQPEEEEIGYITPTEACHCFYRDWLSFLLLHRDKTSRSRG